MAKRELAASSLQEMYPHFYTNQVNDINLGILWKGLQAIRKKYSEALKGIDPFERYWNGVTDAESKLCYEQARYLEYVEWTGKDIPTVPDIEIPYVTYRRMSVEQLRYYLYWRTCLRHGELIIPGYRTYAYLCVYELLAGLGNHSSEKILEQLETLYAYEDELGLTNVFWVNEFAAVHHLEIKNDTLIRKARRFDSSAQKAMVIANIISGTYDHAFDEIYKRSSWKFKNKAFARRSGCQTFLADTIVEMLPELDQLFQANDISFWDFLLGRVRKAHNIGTIYARTIWNPCVLNEIFSDSRDGMGYHYEIEHQPDDIYITAANGTPIRSTSTYIGYDDPYLSTYIIQYTEMTLRQRIGCVEISLPDPLDGALKQHFADGDCYILSADPQWNYCQKKYLNLYQDGSINRVIEATVAHHIDTHGREFQALVQNYAAETHSNVASSPQPAPIDRIIKYINEAEDSANQFEGLLDVYNSLTPSQKKVLPQRARTWIWDYWILHNNSIPFATLQETIVKNNWMLPEIKAIINRNYYSALPYLLSVHDPTSGILTKFFQQDAIRDTVLITFDVIDRLFAMYEIDSSEILLGLSDTYVWHIYDDGDKISNNCNHAVCKNIGGLEIYHYDPTTQYSTVYRHSYSDEATAFIGYVLRCIDNHLRWVISLQTHKEMNMLKNNRNIGGLYRLDGYSDVCALIPDVVDRVISKVMFLQMSVSQAPIIYDILVTSDNERMYRCDDRIQTETLEKSLPSLIDKTVNNYYGV